MPSSPVRLGSLIVTAVVAAAVVAQAAAAPRSPQPQDRVVASGHQQSRSEPIPTPGRQGVRPATHKSGTKQRRTKNVIYLTFDDGPTALYTPAVLKLLAKYHAKATFFELGIQIEEFPNLPARVKAAGHRVGDHTYDHKMLTSLPMAKVRWEIQHGPKSKCFRPPFRDTNQQIAAVAASYGMRQVLWTVDTEDWKHPGTARIEHAILYGARPGAVILMHDGGGDRSQTLAALGRALPKLAKRGYVFESLDC